MNADVIILGLGAMGSSAAFHLARRGMKVLGIDQFGVPHDRGSSHGKSRMIRLAYYEHPDYVPLLRRAYELWNELGQLSGTKLLYRTGGLYLGAPGCELIEGSLRSARRHGLAHELLDTVQVASRFPQFSLPANTVALYEPAAGFLLPEEVIETNVELARRNGAHIHENQRILDWSCESAGVTVRSEGAEYRARKLVLCAGAWMGSLLADLASNFTVTRQILAWFAPQDPVALALGRLPVWAIDHPAGGLHYGFPMHVAADGFKCAFHRPAESADPDHLDRTLHESDVAAIRDVVARWLPGSCETLIRHAVCMYTNSPDHHFILDVHPSHDNVILASCCSGHGFKFASVIGEILADLATNGATKHPIDFLSLKRFA